jgi:aminopeptidase N
MEHWGLINYREKLLLFDPRESSAENKDLIERVVAHEMAHQWFGNLVTMEWWTE